MKKPLFALMIAFSPTSLAYADPSASAGIFQSSQNIFGSTINNLAVIQQVPIAIGGGGSPSTAAVIYQGSANVVNSTITNQAMITQVPIFIYP